MTSKLDHIMTASSGYQLLSLIPAFLKQALIIKLLLLCVASVPCSIQCCCSSWHLSSLLNSCRLQCLCTWWQSGTTLQGQHTSSFFSPAMMQCQVKYFDANNHPTVTVPSVERTWHWRCYIGQCCLIGMNPITGKVSLHWKEIALPLHNRSSTFP